LLLDIQIVDIHNFTLERDNNNSIQIFIDVLLLFVIQFIYEVRCNLFNKFSCGHRIFAAEMAGDDLKIDFIFYFSEFFVPDENEIQAEIILIFDLFMEFKTRLDANLIAGEMADKLIVDNDNDWNGDKARASEKHELAKSHFRNHDRRNKGINIQIKCDINICERKMKNEKIFKKSENSFI
jgi:hypothetical protein